MRAVNCYHYIMVRTQVSLRSEQIAALRQRASEQRVSIATLVRDAVDAFLRNEQRDRDTARALRAVGSYRTAPDNVAEEHDRLLDEIYRS